MSAKSIKRRAAALNEIDSALSDLEDAIDHAAAAGIDVERMRSLWRELGDEHAGCAEELAEEEG